MGLSANVHLKLEARETIASELSGTLTVPHKSVLLAEEFTLPIGTTVPITDSWSDRRTMGGTAETLDLTALVHVVLGSIDLSGLKVQAIKVAAAAANNAAGLNFTNGAANPYDIFGAAGDAVTVLPGMAVLVYAPDKLEDVDATHKTIDVAGTAGDVYEIVILAG